MKRLFAVGAALILVAATPQETIPGLEAEGYFIEAGSTATEDLVSEAVFEGRAEGGRLYIVVLAEEPPGGATTFSDSVLDALGEGYVVTVAPETVGFAGDGSFWTADEMNQAIDASLGGGSDDEVVAVFTDSLTSESVGGDDAVPAAGGGIPFVWILLIGGGVVAVWVFMSRKSRSKAAAEKLEEVRQVARGKLDEVANDILAMEDEVAVSDNGEVKMHYQRASKMYVRANEDLAAASSIGEMLDVSEELDLAIWELDCAEAALDGKPKPAKPEPPQAEPAPPASVPEGHVTTPPADIPGPQDRFDRRPQRQSSGSGEMLEMLLAMMAMGGIRGGGGFGGGFGGFRGGPGRSMGGGRRSMGGGGRMRGGGRRG